jgi:hypothetical protein
MNPMNKHARSVFSQTAKRVALLVGLVATLTVFSSAQLTNTATSENFGCSGYTPARPPNATAYSNWVYTDSAGVKHDFTGGDYVEVQESWYQYPREAPITCGANITTSLDAYSTDGLYYLQATGGGGTVAAAGFVNPKYVVVGITYAPPGPSSSVQYTGTTSVGNTTTIANSFANDVGFSVSVKATIQGWGAGGSVTGTSSTDYTQGSNSSTTTTFSKLTSLAYKTAGTGNAFSPVASDYDTIWLWLNPVVLLTYTPATSKTTADIQWNGFGYDTTDPSGKEQPDVYPVLVGWLNGHFGSSASINKILARGWVSPTMIWPAGQGPGLTSTDIANIIAADPLTGTYTLLDSFPSTTSDGRFTIMPGTNSPNPIPYTQAGPGNGGGLTAIYSTTQTNTESVAQGTSHTFKQAFGMQEVFSGKVFDIGLTTTLNQTDTLTWTHSWLNTLTTTTTLQDALSVTGPSCPAPPPGPCSPVYAGPGQFLLYQDNQFGTFLFYPAN